MTRWIDANRLRAGMSAIIEDHVQIFPENWPDADHRTAIRALFEVIRPRSACDPAALPDGQDPDPYLASRNVISNCIGS